LPPLRFGQRDAAGAGEEVVDVIGDPPAEEERGEDEDGGAHQAAAQLVEVFEERHLAAEPAVRVFIALLVCALRF
jgi:hypothetical protein